MHFGFVFVDPGRGISRPALAVHGHERDGREAPRIEVQTRLRSRGGAGHVAPVGAYLTDRRRPQVDETVEMFVFPHHVGTAHRVPDGLGLNRYGKAGRRTEQLLTARTVTNSVAVPAIPENRIDLVALDDLVNDPRHELKVVWALRTGHVAGGVSPMSHRAAIGQASGPLRMCRVGFFVD